MNKGQESKSQILNQLNILKNDESDQKSSLNCNLTNDSKTSEKTNTVTDIINKKISNMETYLNSKVINIYQRPWNKLEQKLKIRKLQEYYNSDNNILDLSESKKKVANLKDIMTFSEARSALVTSRKKFKVDYDQENCVINSILIDN